VLHPQSKSYFDPWSGNRFGEGGVEQHLALKPHEEVVKGKPIMQKLGNETAKCAISCRPFLGLTRDEQGRIGKGDLETTVGPITTFLFYRVISLTDRHTITLRYPEVFQSLSHPRKGRMP